MSDEICGMDYETIQDELLQYIFNHPIDVRDYAKNYAVSNNIRIPVNLNLLPKFGSRRKLLNEVYEKMKYYPEPSALPVQNASTIKNMYVDGIPDKKIDELIGDDLVFDVLASSLSENKEIIEWLFGDDCADEIVENHMWILEDVIPNMIIQSYGEDIPELKRTILFYLTDTDELIEKAYEMVRQYLAEEEKAEQLRNAWLDRNRDRIYAFAESIYEKYKYDRPKKMGNSMITGDLFYSDIDRLIKREFGKSKYDYDIYHMVIEYLEEKGFWIHS